MKKFETPEIEVQKFVVEDVMTDDTSGGVFDDETGLDPAGLYGEE